MCVYDVQTVILSGLVGLWPGANGQLTVNPLIPATILPSDLAEQFEDSDSDCNGISTLQLCLRDHAYINNSGL